MHSALGKHSTHVSSYYYTITKSSKTSIWTESKKEANLLDYQDCGPLLPTVLVVLQYE